jgi:hypothetical protein
MTIQTAILADSPLLYWPLDDATGPAASDASGNGNTGVYGGSFLLQQRGPETGTFCVYFNGEGEVASLAQSPQRVEPFTIEVWIAQQALYTAGGALAYNGTGTSNGTGLVWETGNVNQNQLTLLRGGVGLFNTGYGVQDQIWHQYAMSRSAVPEIQVWVDGAIVAPLQVGGAMNAIPGGDKFHAGPGIHAEREYVAHVALWPSVLTSAQILSHYQGRTAVQEPSGTLADVSLTLQSCCDTMSALLAQIYAAVHRTYP